METFSVSLALCAGNSPVTAEFPSQRPVTRSFDVFFDLRLNKRLSKQSWCWWFETPSGPLWRHCNAFHEFFDTGVAHVHLVKIMLKANQTTKLRFPCDFTMWWSADSILIHGVTQLIVAPLLALGTDNITNIWCSEILSGNIKIKLRFLSFNAYVKMEGFDPNIWDSYEPFTQQSQYHGWWWPGDTRTQGINWHDIDWFFPE